MHRWIINYKEIHVDKQVGSGSLGIVYRGRWKGIDVAVKRLIKQQIPESSMLELRAEIATLAELHHPNVLVFVGTVVFHFLLRLNVYLSTYHSHLRSLLEGTECVHHNRVRSIGFASQSTV